MKLYFRRHKLMFILHNGLPENEEVQKVEEMADEILKDCSEGHPRIFYEVKGSSVPYKGCPVCLTRKNS